MKKMNKKRGFTITELVVVISVIAILAAVMVPVFSGIVGKAKKSADEQAVMHMNNLIVADSENIDSVDDVIQILIENDYAKGLTTYQKGNELAWVASEKAIVLVQNDEIVYPKQYVGKNLVFEKFNPVVTDGDSLQAGLTDGKVVHVSENITTDDYFAPAEAGTYEVNLNGNKLNASNEVGAWVEGSKLTLSNGTVDARNSEDNVAVFAGSGAIVELSDVQVLAASGTNALQCYGGTMVLNNVTTAQSGSNGAAWYDSAIQVINTIKQVNGKWEIYGEQTNLTVNGGMYSGKRAIQISAPGGNVTITDGTFIGTDYAICADFAPQNYGNSAGYQSVITISGGNFTGKIKVSAATVLTITGGTFSVDPSAWVVAGYKAVQSNGAWTVVKA